MANRVALHKDHEPQSNVDNGHQPVAKPVQKSANELILGKFFAEENQEVDTNDKDDDCRDELPAG